MRTGLVALMSLALLAGDASAQKSLREQIVGTWDFVVAEVTAPDGKKSFPFGETPKGILIFTPDGRFTQIHVASDVPKIASGNRLTGTAEEYAAIMRRSLSVFGSYMVDEEKKTVTFKIVSSTFPNWEGEAQTRTIDKLTADEFVNTNPNVAGGRGSASNSIGGQNSTDAPRLIWWRGAKLLGLSAKSGDRAGRSPDDRQEANDGLRKLQQAEDAKKAMAEYRAQAAAVDANTERLRALRLAKERPRPRPPGKAVKKKPAKKAGRRSPASLSQWLKDREQRPQELSRALAGIATLHRPLRRVQELLQLLRVPLGRRRGAVAGGRLARRNQQQLRVLDALELALHDPGLRRIALVVGRVDRQHARPGCWSRPGAAIVVARGFPGVEIVVGVDVSGAARRASISLSACALVGAAFCSARFPPFVPIA